MKSQHELYEEKHMDNTKKNFRILAINPGSTSTKVGIFDRETCIVEKVVRHDREELDRCGGEGVYGQKELRRRLVLETLAGNNIPLESLDATVGRAALLPPMTSGTYRINQTLLDAVPDPLPRPALLGMIMAKEIGDQLGIPSFIVDPANVDEFWELSRVTGIPGVQRFSSLHALNHKASARRAAKELGKAYEDCRMVIAHMGGGISVAAHLNGFVVDATSGGDGEGPFSPERAGYIPGRTLVNLCCSGKYTARQLEGFFIREGGIQAYLGTSDLREVEKMMQEGNEQAKLLFDAMAYNVGKTIGSMYAVLDAEADAIVLTGGLAYSKLFCEKLTKMVGKMAKVIVYPGEAELLSMVQGSLRVLNGEIEAKIFGV